VAWLIAAVLALTVVGLAVALGLSGGSAPGRAVPPTGGPRTVPFPGGRLAPGQLPGRIGGVIGTVTAVGTNQFTVKAIGGGTVTVNEQSSTTYDNGGAVASSSAVTAGVRVAVAGTRSGNTISATRVIVLGAGAFGREGVPGSI